MKLDTVLTAVNDNPLYPTLYECGNFFIRT